MTASPASGSQWRLASLPQVDAVLRAEGAAQAIARHGRRSFTDAVRTALDEARARVRDGAAAPSAAEVLTTALRGLARTDRRAVTRVINAAGVVVHTNLGRAPLSGAARRAAADAAGYATVEYDLDTGARGSRTAHVGELAARLSDTPAATVVNNGAAALVLTLAALAGGREAIVSRGEQIEIGGSFRLPDVMATSGVTTVEVGTTNRTRPDDYRAAIGERTAVLIKVHRSNFRQIGFTQEATATELAAVAAESGLPFVYDVGSGLLRDVEVPGPLAALQNEPSVATAVAAGADLVVFSGDKLLGGPQAGIIAGRRDLVDACRWHPLARALRVDKLQLAALEATLVAHLRDELPMDVPTIAMLAADPDDLRTRAAALMAGLAGAGRDRHDTAAGPADITVVDLDAVVGGGALPGVALPSAGLAIATSDPDALAGRLRSGAVPVIVRIERDRVLLDLRTVAPVEDDELLGLLDAALR